MEEKIESENKEENKEENLISKDIRTEKEIAMDFALQVVKKFDRLIKA